MDSFEELGVAPELVEALAAEGIERPTPLQEDAIPLLRQGNNLVMTAGPGSGVMVCWALPLLERVVEDLDAPQLLVLTSTPEVADRLGESLARLASASGISVAALGSPWSLPGYAKVVLGTPADVLAATAAGDVSLTDVSALVLDQAQAIESLVGLEDVERVIDYLAPDAQRVLSALPLTDTVSDLVERHVRRTLIVPAPDADKPPKRGGIRFRITPEPREAAALAMCAELLPDDARHLLFFCRSDDRAADLGDYLTLHGYMAGAPGDLETPVWLGVDALSARTDVKGIEGVVVISCDVPADPDTLDRRHGIGPGGVVLVVPRELAHLKSLGRQTGYETVPFPPPAAGPPTSVVQLRATLEHALETEDSAPYMSVLEPLFERYDPAEVAAAAVALLRSRGSSSAPEAPQAAPASLDPGATPAWAKLFIGVGERDGLRAGDLLGAITGEAGVDGHAVGKIDIHESHTVVEVHDGVARKVIKALNGTTIRGRAVRADFDRPRRGAPPARRR
ncbi:MAG: DEAD/DEAH box helicase [Gemmatimonadota bacterium]|nr:DEAD/DEAH box helicase [Gemmatimonadota bacterium]